MNELIVYSVKTPEEYRECVKYLHKKGYEFKKISIEGYIFDRNTVIMAGNGMISVVRKSALKNYTKVKPWKQIFGIVF